MKKMYVFLFLALAAFSYAGCGGCELKSHKSHKNLKAVKKAKSAKKAVAKYLCTCTDKTWKQDSDKTKSCPYCGPSMPDCGVLKKLYPKRGVSYSIDDYELPNDVCPVMNKPVNKAISTTYKGKKVYFCCPGCISKFNKRPARYLKKISLKKTVLEHKHHAGCSHGKSKGCPIKKKGKHSDCSHGSHEGHDHGKHKGHDKEKDCGGCGHDH